ncbi:MAG: hypothetical protein DMF81_17550 [Acidobacteria bacterium]|nr:MAG: hypothetical protein DMF81_17550 [Acidobacteriota bacterium]
MAKSARGWRAELKRQNGPAPLEGRFAPVSRGRRGRLKAIRAIDFFDAPARREAEASLAAFEGQILSGPAATPGTRHHELAGRTWVTRKGIQVDRIASAWFVRRFLDPRASTVGLPSSTTCTSRSATDSNCHLLHPASTGDRRSRANSGEAAHEAVIPHARHSFMRIRVPVGHADRLLGGALGRCGQGARAGR